jgi:tetratricopeptide (TPR) repeat protein
MPADEQLPIEAAESFESLSKLRAAHVDLMRAMRRDGHDDDLVRRVRKFLDRAKATGTRIDSPADRDTAENIIMYWVSYLFTVDDREALSAAVPALDAFDPSNAPDLSKVANPYQGLNAFGEDDAGRFFGREEAVKILLDKLRDQLAVLVIGPMGSGKTSLVAAGLIPRLKSRMISEDNIPVFPVVLPGPDPLAALLRGIHEVAADPALPGLGAWISEQKKKLERSPAYLSALLETVFPGRPVIIVVDQFEEVFTLCSDSNAREKFAVALISVCPRAQAPNRAILIIDERYQQRALQLAALKPFGENPAARFSLPPLSPAEVLRIIESAATTVGLKFDEGIVEDLAKDVAGDVGALPALQFTLGQLWDERKGNRIDWDAYNKVGRPREALKRTAEAAFDSLSSEEKEAARKLFLALAHPTIEGDFTHRRIRRGVLSQLDSSGSAARVLERYVEAGLIRHTPGADWEDDRFEVAHDALINSWPMLRDWLQNERELSKKKLQLVATARLWQESGFNSGDLLSDNALDEAETYTEAAPELRELVAASRDAARRARRRRNKIKSALTAVTIFLAGLASAGWYVAWQEAQSSQRSAEKALNAVERMLDVVSSDLQTGDIPTKVATDLLRPANDIFTAVEDRPELSAIRVELMMKFSDLYLLAGDRAQALDRVERARALTERFIAQDPGDDDWRRRLYEIAFRVGDIKARDDLEKAVQEYHHALRIAQQFAAKDPANGAKQRNIAFIENKIGDIFYLKEKWEQALERYRASLSIGEQLTAREPDDPEWQKIIGDARKRIGDLFARQKRWPEAFAEYEGALAIQQSIAEKFPENDVYQSNLSRSYHQLGDAYKADNKPQLALQQYEKAFEIRNRLAGKDPDNVEWQRALATEHVAIADVSADRRDAARAIENYRGALTIREQLASLNPGDDEGWRRIAVIRGKLADVLVGTRQFDAALKENRAALEIRTRFARKFPDNIDRQRELAAAHERVGDALKAHAEHRKSRDDLRKALDAYEKSLAVIDDFMLKDPKSGLASARGNMQEKVRSLAQSVRR